MLCMWQVTKQNDSSQFKSIPRFQKLSIGWQMEHLSQTIKNIYALFHRPSPHGGVLPSGTIPWGFVSAGCWEAGRLSHLGRIEHEWGTWNWGWNCCFWWILLWWFLHTLCNENKTDITDDFNASYQWKVTKWQLWSNSKTYLLLDCMQSQP